jgi:arylsulfatase A-like enzyme
VDHSIGVLLAELDSLEGKTLLIITSDHGESFVDDEFWFDHGVNLRYPCLNVPLVMRCEGAVPVGVRDALVGNADLAPTILDLLGINR